MTCGRIDILAEYLDATLGRVLARQLGSDLA